MAAAGDVRGDGRLGVWRIEAGGGGAEAPSRPSETRPVEVWSGRREAAPRRLLRRVGAALGEWRWGPRLRLCFVLIYVRGKTCADNFPLNLEI